MPGHDLLRRQWEMIPSADNKAFEDQRGACVSFTWIGELWFFVICHVQAELPVADQVRGSMFGVVNLKLDCLDADCLGVGGWRVQHSTKGDLTCDFCTLIMRWKTQSSG